LLGAQAPVVVLLVAVLLDPALLLQDEVALAFGGAAGGDQAGVLGAAPALLGDAAFAFGVGYAFAQALVRAFVSVAILATILAVFAKAACAALGQLAVASCTALGDVSPVARAL
ncbi:MAG TPA: hypothetical protein VHF86_05900, partial [Xanthomonadaceae bacterium]|nr:hypothetical protein [Xanthomonadaceae bacterium]